METYDAEKAARVWQRVRGFETPDPSLQESGEPEELLRLIQGELGDAAAYLHLSRRVQGKQAAMLHRLFEEEQAHAACLKGIYRLIAGQPAAASSPAPPQEPIEVTLRKCYGREMHSLADYEARSAHPEYGPVFQKLSAQEREHCRMVLQLLGGWK